MNAISSQETKTSGSMIWSIRSQSVNGGAIIHGEYNGVFAYHWPGYNKGPQCYGFTPDNSEILSSLKVNSFLISDSAGIARPSNYPPCSHIPTIIQATIASYANTPFSGCIQVFNHSSFSEGNYRRIDLKIRQATGSWTNVVQMSFDGTNFKTVGNVDMTVQENNFLVSHQIPTSAADSGNITTLYYRIVGLLSDNQYSTGSKVVAIKFDEIDANFINYILSLSNGVSPTPGAPVCMCPPTGPCYQVPTLKPTSVPTVNPTRGPTNLPTFKPMSAPSMKPRNIKISASKKNSNKIVKGALDRSHGGH